MSSVLAAVLEIQEEEQVLGQGDDQHHYKHLEFDVSVRHPGECPEKSQMQGSLEAKGPGDRLDV